MNNQFERLAAAESTIPQPATTSLFQQLVARLAGGFRRRQNVTSTIAVLDRKPLTPTHTLFLLSCNSQRFLAAAHPTGISLWPVQIESTEDSRKS
jgi:hypothetical protein